MKNNDYVVLVDSQNKVLGTAPKLKAHNSNTPLHRGFSLFLFNKKGELLLQQRSKKKKTWPLTWSNSCCGHPGLNEKVFDAVWRRLNYELGIGKIKLYNILPNFSYRAKKDGIVENELCPVLIGFTGQEPKINKEEVEDIKWIPWKKFIKEIEKNPGGYSPWCVEEIEQLKNNDRFLHYYKNFTS
ncbi:MAG: isopentenyl-diphosphate delta-isomerase [Candidatus Levybacteria bacterium RIFCSPLOWO2_02_FULL_37_10]|nr:MAG: isopentenyl-diphosphate delta-isomerase [Candidatus Levybacteria bacterium RIFCSPHIGHO2_01_FULL_37_33]OGH15757.1 MAG: isopentenyl-diphosphate delta-isomerase [Candidatus Levybacteria bacterium RIFCSPHIGHO2_02_FULL_37_11]OGH29665.1 MAG: isopentenyl-diphosphate delta-isomerase [Candidatus Levybacteria bacterium RIFCSPHIGHO2_12_FULL_37_12]OGH32591.1 MAG: isopentenyl-diphosphate delta-isomerase [Candidatus Levybacteria bacterium RIFCSPLOWO2_01_FULL_36_54]OGH43205.1 MAG: isopentenyl-diphosph